MKQRKPITTLIENDTLRLRALDGETSTLVIAFTGIGHKMGASQQNEFVGTASGEGENSVIFVADLMRSWFSHPQMVETIVEEVRNYTDRHGITRILTIGNSMGAFGALLLPDLIDVEVAAAFSPQYTMRLDIVAEERWRKFRHNMHEPNLWALNDKLNDTTRYFALFGAEHEGDKLHADAFADRKNLYLRRVAHAGHNLSAELRRAGLLRSAVDAMFAKDTELVDKVLDDYEANPPPKIPIEEKRARRRAKIKMRREKLAQEKSR